MHKHLRIVFFLVLLLGLNSLQAQNNIVSNAIQAFHDGDYEKTYLLTSESLANPDRLSGDYIPAAYYYLAKSRIQLLRMAIEGRDQEKLAGMQNALIESYLDYKEALKAADAQLKTDIQRDLLDLYNPILQTGLSALNTANDNKQQMNVRQAALKASFSYLQAARDISPSYLACDLLGQAYLAAGDSIQALELLGESIAAYRKAPPSPPDFLVAYVYFRKAIIERYSLHNNNKALSTLTEGQTLIKTEYSKLNSANGDPAQRKEFENGLIDLIGFELDIYLNDTLLTDEALIRFREVLVMYPEDYDIHVSYASLLENVDVNLAIDAYETAISIDESRELAYFNLGALYNNMGSDYYLDGLNEDDDVLAEKLFNQANDCFRKAYINMEEAYRLNPRSLHTIRALVQLAGTLGLDDKAEFYKQKENELRGF